MLPYKKIFNNFSSHEEINEFLNGSAALILVNVSSEKYCSDEINYDCNSICNTSIIIKKRTCETVVKNPEISETSIYLNNDVEQTITLPPLKNLVNLKLSLTHITIVCYFKFEIK